MIRLKTKRYTRYIGKKQVPIAQAMAKLLHVYCKGIGKAMTNRDIIAYFAKKNIYLKEPEVRHYINFICVNYLPNLVGSPNGYYVTDKENDLRRCMRSLVSRSRENRMRAEIIHTFIDNTLPTKGQLRIDFPCLPNYFRINGQLKINF
jgi:hypothetical protein